VTLSDRGLVAYTIKRAASENFFTELSHGKMGDKDLTGSLGFMAAIEERSSGCSSSPWERGF
jgi:hypothetical protein